ncbi:MAG TPA: hypothetical protein VGF94_01030 [Kofleriaceae bacterium]|jgi:hypothetical protein
MRALVVAMTLVGLAGCKEVDPLYCQQHDCSDDGGVLPPGFVTIAGTVDVSLEGAGLVLQDQGMNDIRVDTPGAFKFSPVMQGPYDVTVSTQPTNPSQNCTVANGTGNATGDVADITVSCITAMYTLGGTIIGLTSGQTAVLDDGTDQITVTGPATTFVFPALASGTPYAVTIPTNPGGACVVAGDMGKIGNSDVMTVVVNCVPDTTTLGGMVTGLVGSVQLTNTINSDVITVPGNGTYAFDMTIPTQPTSSWNVIVSGPPTWPPAAQDCTMMNGSGSNPGGPAITTIDVSCATHAFSIGGTSAGVTGSVELVDNADATDIQTVTSSTTGFTFTKPIPSNDTYAVSVYSEPPTLGCTIANATGTVMNSDITNVTVTCAYKNPGVACGGADCSGGTPDCCDPGGGNTCVTGGGSCSKLLLPCDDNADCGGGKICCALQHAHSHGFDRVDSVSCASSCTNSADIVLCDPNASGECHSGTSCRSYSLLRGYYACQ